MKKIATVAAVAALAFGAGAGIAYAAVSDTTTPIGSISFERRERVQTGITSATTVAVSCGEGSRAIGAGVRLDSEAGGPGKTRVLQSYPYSAGGTQDQYWGAMIDTPTGGDPTTVTVTVTCLKFG